ncbi:hypothetical protein OBCHQ24_03330 [Oceanobacillus iheyensis]|nr:hypothetical protein OBCHQ24_03330 [Oceanobacillus iheyensis]
MKHMHPTLKAMVTTAPLLKEILGENTIIAVTDKENYIYFSPSKSYDIGVKAGDFAMKEENQALIKAIAGEKTNEYIPKEYVGVAIQSSSSPLTDEHGEIIGALMISTTLEEEEEVGNELLELRGIINSLQGKVEHVATQAEKLSATSADINNQATIATANSEEISKVVQLIENISAETNLLGLNASIEAARSGEAGLGFGVVADEIRKLSDGTKEAVGTIGKSLSEIQASISNLKHSIEEISISTDEQSTVMTEFTEDISKLDKQSEEITQYVKEIMQ